MTTIEKDCLKASSTTYLGIDISCVSYHMSTNRCFSSGVAPFECPEGDRCPSLGWDFCKIKTINKSIVIRKHLYSFIITLIVFTKIQFWVYKKFIHLPLQ